MPEKKKINQSETTRFLVTANQMVADGEERNMVPVLFLKPYHRDELIAMPPCDALETDSIQELIENVNVERYLFAMFGGCIEPKDKDCENVNDLIKELSKKASEALKKYIKNTKAEDLNKEDFFKVLKPFIEEFDDVVELKEGFLIIEVLPDAEHYASSVIVERNGFRYLDMPEYKTAENKNDFSQIQMNVSGKEGEKKATRNFHSILPFGSISDPACSDKDIAALQEGVNAIGFFISGHTPFKWGENVRNSGFVKKEAVN